MTDVACRQREPQSSATVVPEDDGVGQPRPACRACSICRSPASSSSCCSRSTGWRSRRSNRTPSSTTTRPTTRSGSPSRRSTTSASCCSTPPIRAGCSTTMTVAVAATFLSLFSQRARGLCHPAAALQGQPVRRASPSTWPTWCRRRSCSFRSPPWSSGSASSTRPLALILVYPTFLVPFCTWLLIGYFKSIPYELEECALIDGATRLQILRQITLAAGRPRLISRRHLLLHAVLERVHLRARLHPERARRRPCRWRS